MSKHRVRSPDQALAYITDCNLATVMRLAMKKSRPKHEFERQISIAQTAIDWMIAFGADFSGTRAEDVVKAGGSVQEWIAPVVARYSSGK